MKRPSTGQIRKGFDDAQMERAPDHWKCNGEVQNEYILVKPDFGPLRLILADLAKHARTSETELMRELFQLALDDLGDYSPFPKPPGCSTTLHSRVSPEMYARIEELRTVMGVQQKLQDVLRGLLLRGLTLYSQMPDPQLQHVLAFKAELKEKYGDWNKKRPKTFLGGAKAIEDFLKDFGE